VKLIFAEEAWDDYLYWQQQDKRMVERINKLICETRREPFAGIGNPKHSNTPSPDTGHAVLPTNTAWCTALKAMRC